MQVSDPKKSLWNLIGQPKQMSGIPRFCSNLMGSDSRYDSEVEISVFNIYMQVHVPTLKYYLSIEVRLQCIFEITTTTDATENNVFFFKPIKG
jgi:hypothetical protein